MIYLKDLQWLPDTDYSEINYMSGRCSNHWAIQTLTQGDSHTECLAFRWAAEIPSHRSGRCSNHWANQTLTQGDSHTECLAFRWAAEIPSHRSGCVLTTGLIQTLTQGDSHTECLAFRWAAEIPSHRSGCVLTTGLSRHWLKVTVTLNAWPFDGLLRYHHTGLDVF